MGRMTAPVPAQASIPHSIRLHQTTRTMTSFYLWSENSALVDSALPRREREHVRLLLANSGFQRYRYVFIWLYGSTAHFRDPSLIGVLIKTVTGSVGAFDGQWPLSGRWPMNYMLWCQLIFFFRRFFYSLLPLLSEALPVSSEVLPALCKALPASSEPPHVPMGLLTPSRPPRLLVKPS